MSMVLGQHNPAAVIKWENC